MAEMGLRWGIGDRAGPGPREFRLHPHPCVGSWPVLARVQEQLTSRWEGNRALAERTRDQLARHEAGLMDLRGALNRAVGTIREAEELNSQNQERLEEVLVRGPPLLPSPTHLPAPQAPCYVVPSFCPRYPLLPCGLQQRKQELSRDNATLSATLQAARNILAQLSERLHGMDQAREVSATPGGTQAGPGGALRVGRASGSPHQVRASRGSG